MQLIEITWSAPVVIAYRTARIATGGWPPSARAEAFSQAAVAAVTTPPKDTGKALGNVLAPVHRRVVANRRRLSRG